MSDASWESCTGTFYDSGGSGGAYANSEDFTATLCPTGGAGSGPATSVTFLSFNVQPLDLADELVIYDGTSTSDPILATGGFLNDLTGQTFTATSPSGCLTFHWTSDPLTTDAGWVAEITTGPDAGANAAISICSDDASFDMTAQLGGTPDAGGQWTAPGGANHGSIINPATDVGGSWTYTVSGVAPCAAALATLTITRQIAPDAGSSTAVTLCDDDGPLDLFAALGGTPDPGGSWTDPNGDPFGSIFDPGADDPGFYTYSLTGVPPCTTVAATVDVTVNHQPVAGVSTSTTICSDDVPFSLFALLGPTAEVGGTWVGPGGPHPDTYTPGVSPGGLYTYTITALLPCVTAAATVNVTQQTAPDAGTAGNSTVCSDDPPFLLTDALNGTPDPGGQWTDPDGDPFVGNTFDPATDEEGEWTYTVSGTLPCTNANATLTVIVRPAPDAGISASVTVCSNRGSFVLLDSLGGTPDINGTWTAPLGGAFNGTYIPGTSEPGIYTYTVTGQSPCDPAQSTLTVNEQVAPNAGDNATVLFCSDDASVVLFSLLGGTPDVGGSWTDGNNAPHGATFDPGADDAGVYTYTAQGLPPCADALATVSITVTEAPEAGLSTSVSVCSIDPPFNLLDSLGGTPDAGGTWTDPNSVVVPTGVFQPGVSQQGTYTYTVTGQPPCTDAVATVQVGVETSPSAGTNATLSICSDAPNVDLFTLLGGTPDAGGNWFDPNAAAHSGIYQPGTQIGGTYVYIVSGDAPCVNDSSTVQITRQIAPRAGTDGSTTVCSNTGQFTLISVLGGNPMLTGSWSDPNGVAFPSGTFIPGASLPGIYRYVVVGTAPCSNDTAFATVNVQTAPVAGINGNHTVCGNGTPFSLATFLGGTPDPGGSWTGPGVAPHGQIYDPANDVPDVYTYTVAGIPPCANATATVVVQEVVPPNAGTNATVSVCTTAPAFALIDSLNGTPQPGGSWTGPGGAMNGTFVPGTSPQGQYTYVVAGTLPCGPASSIVTVVVNTAPSAGGDGAQTVCANSGSIDLFGLLQGTFTAGGDWIDDDACGQLNGSLLNTNGLAIDSYNFTYAVDGNGQCPADSARVIITIVPQLNAGATTFQNLCGNESAYVLFAHMNGNPDPGGAWSDDDNSNALANGIFNATLVNPGTYDFTYQLDGGGFCPDDQATMTINVVGEPDAGLNSAILVCGNGGSFQLFNVLGGTPDGGGTWWFNNLPHSPSYNPSNDMPGTYEYRVEGDPPCADSIAYVIVSEVTEPDAGINDDIAVCTSDAPFELLDSLGGTPDPTGSWQAPNSSPHSGLFVPGVDVAGAYLYSVPGTFPCNIDVAILTVGVDAEPDAGSDGQVTVCSNSGSFLLSDHLGGTPDTDGTWKGPGGAPHSVLFDPDVDVEGDYTYLVPANASCDADSSIVSVFVNNEANAGTSTSAVACPGAGSVQLFPLLGGADNTGAWTDPLGAVHGGVFNPLVDTPGDYKYKVIGVAPCGNDSAIVNVLVNAPPNAGTSVTRLKCSSDPCFSLFAELGGTPGVIGASWTGPNNTPSDGIFCPGTSTPGVYVYTVSGDAPCPNATATVTVGVSQAVNAGDYATTQVCRPGPTINLFNELGGTPQPGGNWLRPITLAPHSGLFLPNSDAAGLYRYVRTAVSPCANDTAGVTVVLNEAWDAGANGVTVICDDAQAFGLITLLGGTPDLNGTWTDPDNLPEDGLYFPVDHEPGVYTYTVPAIGACAADQSTVTVIENHAPWAGGDGAIELCSDAGDVDLFTVLQNTPEPGGDWFDANGDPFSGVYIPGSSAQGSFTYVLLGNAPCVNDTAYVEVSENPAPDAGFLNVVSLCSDGPEVQLIGLLNGTPQPGGLWTGPNGPVPSGEWDPTTDTGGAYQYVVLGLASCGDDSATVQINKVIAPNAGEDGDLTVCVDATGIALINGLNGTPQLGGTWTNNSNIGQLNNGVLNAIGVLPGTYTFTYTRVGNAPCTPAAALLTLTIVQGLDAGADTTVQVCESENFVLLYPLLGGAPQAGGDWFDVDGSGAMLNGVFNAGLAGVGTWHFEYVLEASASCVSDTSVLTVEVLEGPNAGCDGGVTVCANTGGFLLLQFVNCSPDATGTWTDPGGFPHDGSFDPTTDPEGEYVYEVAGVGDCPSTQSIVTVNVDPAPFAGQDTVLSICSEDLPVDLSALLIGETPNGSWVGPGGPMNGFYNPAIHGSGPYFYNVQGSLFCVPDQAQVMVTENLAPNAGLDNALTICSSAAPFNMRGELSGNPDLGGTWYDAGAVVHSEFFQPATDDSGPYTYLILGLGACENDTAVLTVNVVQAANAGNGDTLSVCATETAQNLFEALVGYDTTGFWTDDDATNALTDSLFNATLPGVGLYHFTYTVPGTVPCASDAITIVAEVSFGIDLGAGGVDTICGASPYDLFNSLPIGTDTTGTWTDNSGTGELNGSILNAPALPVGTNLPFTYEVVSPACGPVSVGIFIHIGPYADPGTDTTLAFCDGDPAVSLFDVLGGTPAVGGTWTGPLGPHGSTFDPAQDEPGAYIYLVPGIAPCADSSATVTISLNQPANAGADSTVVLCNTEDAFDLFTALAGSPQPGGVWTELNSTGTVTGSLLNSTLLTPGTYVFRYDVDVLGCGQASAQVTVQLKEGIQVTGLESTCNEQDRTYTVVFTIVGGDPASYVVTGLPGTLSTVPPYVFTSDPVFTSQAYSLLVNDANNCAPRVIEGVTPCAFDDEVFVPELFSPNGDDINETFQLPGIEGYPSNSVIIFNRWGDEVFKGAGYDNRTVVWDGTAQKSLLSGALPSGTYYYVIELGNSNEPIKGYVYLNR
ncbi:MAG: gliding motility-associated C-terminal domain-containing protein [Flavobacteriales bacterium]|nr:gliding motility-associated C-terminal domain-containing protein [Flavobacteriales bacterium]